MSRKGTVWLLLTLRAAGTTTTSQERRPGRPAARSIFLGPSSCWRKPPRKARTIGGTSSSVPEVRIRRGPLQLLLTEQPGVEDGALWCQV